MADELLSRIRREIGERKAAAREAVEESRRLEAALAALEVQVGRDPDAAPRAARRRRGQPSRARAPRGENRRRLLDAVADSPGATAADLAQLTGIARPTAASTLAKLVADSQLQRIERPGGAVGYAPASAADSGTANPSTAAAVKAPQPVPGPATA